MTTNKSNTLFPPVTSEVIADILATAFSGGINSWCARYRVTKEPTEKTPYDYFQYMAPAYGGEVELILFENGETHVLTYEKILKTLLKLRAEEKLSPDPDDWDFDANEASEVIEITLFGKVTYC